MLKKKLLNLLKFLSEYRLDNRRSMTLFMELKRQYPDYYDIFRHPIDIETMKNNIVADKYGTLDDVVDDFRRMFENCRKYFGNGSQIHEDSNILERALEEKLTPKIIKGGRKQISPMDTKLRQLYDEIFYYRDSETRPALNFIKLPSKSENPDYYARIKNPMDMVNIAKKLEQKSYGNIDEIAADFMLVFENTCQYNNSDTQIYKDALLLQPVLFNI